uniref:Uncharacterized protein n=1 Tax=Ananas comosus var. bracteatus TaxID=296719 RepID=A0A6V7NY97_ANACO|nr:unnamed protein product [Ananas comosus var. bracteatus]
MDSTSPPLNFPSIALPSLGILRPEGPVPRRGDRSLVGETGPREQSWRPEGLFAFGNRSFPGRPVLGDRFLRAGFSGLSQILAFLAGVAHRDRSPQPGTSCIKDPQQPPAPVPESSFSPVQVLHYKLSRTQLHPPPRCRHLGSAAPPSPELGDLPDRSPPPCEPLPRRGQPAAASACSSRGKLAPPPSRCRCPKPPPRLPSGVLQPSAAVPECPGRRRGRSCPWNPSRISCGLGWFRRRRRRSSPPTEVSTTLPTSPAPIPGPHAPRRAAGSRPEQSCSAQARNRAIPWRFAVPSFPSLPDLYGREHGDRGKLLIIVLTFVSVGETPFRCFGGVASLEPFWLLFQDYAHFYGNPRLFRCLWSEHGDRGSVLITVLTLFWISGCRIVLFGAFFPDCALFAEFSGCSALLTVSCCAPDHEHGLRNVETYQYVDFYAFVHLVATVGSALVCVVTFGLIVHDLIAFAKIEKSIPARFSAKFAKRTRFRFGFLPMCDGGFRCRNRHFREPGFVQLSGDNCVVVSGLVTDPLDLRRSGRLVRTQCFDATVTGGCFELVVGEIVSPFLCSFIQYRSLYMQHIDSLVMCFDLVDRGSALYALAPGFGHGTGLFLPIFCLLCDRQRLRSADQYSSIRLGLVLDYSPLRHLFS